MSIKWSDSDHTLPLTPASSFRSPETVTINVAVSTGQLVVNNQGHTQAMTNTSINATNPLVMITNTNQGDSGHPTHHELVWFQLEGWSGGSFDPAQMECQSVTLIMHQELEVMLLRIQWLSYHGVLIKFDSKVNMECVAQKLLRMEWWMGGPMLPRIFPPWWWRRALIVQGRGISGPKGGSITDRSIKVWPNNSHEICSMNPILIITGFLSSWRHSRMDKISQHWGTWGLHTLPYLVAWILPFPRGEATYNQWAFEVHSLQSYYQEEVLQEGKLWSLKGDAADMVQFLGPAPSIKAILDKLDSL